MPTTIMRIKEMHFDRTNWQGMMSGQLQFLKLEILAIICAMIV